MNKKRVVHITLSKCGSQWVRDVLCAPELLRFSGLSYSGKGYNFQHKGTYAIPEGKFSGPIYGLSLFEWQRLKYPGDKAVVVLRDPRDRLVSHLFSTLYSHSSGIRTDCLRGILSSIPNHKKRKELLIWNLMPSVRFYLSWALHTEDDAFVVRYESLLHDQFGEFRRIIDWLGWHVPDETLDPVVERLSFKSRSGRSPGETDIFSHYRRGIQGDWRNHFTRELGRLWEVLYPGFLQQVGYENGNDWWSSLPEEIDAPTPSLSEPNNIDPAMDCQMEVSIQRIKRLEMELDEKEQEIQILSKACRDRLELIERQEQEMRILRNGGFDE